MQFISDDSAHLRPRVGRGLSTGFSEWRLGIREFNFEGGSYALRVREACAWCSCAPGGECGKGVFPRVFV